MGAAKQEHVGRVTYYVIQSFSATEDGPWPDEAVEAPNATAARARARELSVTKVGVVAFSRTGDPTTGEFDDAVILCQFGEVPDNFGSEA